MKINVPKNLIVLAKLVGEDNPLYIVGGYVRNCIMNLSADDIDLACWLNLDALKEKLINSEFKLKIKNKKLGTAEIISEGQVYEYSSFRSESYSKGGGHNPTKIEFADSIFTDSVRRDFSINCIYYNILTDELIDIYGGLSDIKNKIIKTVDDAEVTMAHDGARVLRMIRFSLEFNFKIDAKTYDAAKKYASNVNDLTKERKQIEIEKINNAYKKYKKLTKFSAWLKKKKYFKELNISL